MLRVFWIERVVREDVDFDLKKLFLGVLIIVDLENIWDVLF